MQAASFSRLVRGASRVQRSAQTCQTQGSQPEGASRPPPPGDPGTGDGLVQWLPEEGSVPGLCWVEAHTQVRTQAGAAPHARLGGADRSRPLSRQKRWFEALPRNPSEKPGPGHSRPHSGLETEAGRALAPRVSTCSRGGGRAVREDQGCRRPGCGRGLGRGPALPGWPWRPRSPAPGQANGARPLFAHVGTRLFLYLAGGRHSHRPRKQCRV